MNAELRSEILKAAADELRRMPEVEQPTIRIVSLTFKFDRDQRIRAVEHGTEHHRELT